MRIYLFIAAVAGGVTYLLTPLIRHIAIEIGAVGEVRARDVHTVPTPRMGGLGMLIGFTVAMLFASRIPFIEGLFAQSHQAWVILAGAIMISLLGMADDLWDLDWMLKLAGQLLISVFVAWGGLQIISLPLGSLVTASPSLSMAITAFLIVASINAVNFVDGLDGLASGIVAIGGIAFAIYSYIIARSSPSYASMATLIDIAMVGTCVGFILHNWHPAKLFMGDSGSTAFTNRLLVISTDSVYHPAYKRVPQDEIGVYLHDGGYGSSKRQMEEVFLDAAAHSESPFAWTIFRPGHIFGAGSQVGCFPEHSRQPDLIARMKRGEPLRLVGGGKFLIHPIYVDDLCRVLLESIPVSTAFNEIFCIGGPDIVSNAAITFCSEKF